jgi:hypothetical protein
VLVRHDVPHADVMAAWHGAAAGIVPSIAEAMGRPRVVPFLPALQIFKQCSTLLASFRVQVAPYSQT